MMSYCYNMPSAFIATAIFLSAAFSFSLLILFLLPFRLPRHFIFASPSSLISLDYFMSFSFDCRAAFPFLRNIDLMFSYEVGSMLR